MALRLGVCVLPDQPWPLAQATWREVEAAGVATGWTYDHLSWRTLRDGPWLASVPLLTALAQHTCTLRLGLLVASPNFRHPVPFAKELMTLDLLSAGRLEVGLGAGGTGADATVLGTGEWSRAERTARFGEFVRLLDGLLTAPATSWQGDFYAADDARMIPPSPQQPRPPFTIAATGPRGLQLAARFGQGWVSYGPAHGTDEEGPEEWASAVADQSRALDAICEQSGRDPASLRRTALLGLGVPWARTDWTAVEQATGLLEQAGLTDLVVHWPRPHDPALPGCGEPVLTRLLAG